MVSQKLTTTQELEALYNELIADRDPDQPCVTVCAGTGCCASGALEVHDALEKAIQEHEADIDADLKITGCRGFCEQGPLVAILPKNIFYTKVQPKHAESIISKTMLEGQILK
ncbi:MAG: NADH-quinone oxidoreductase subunit F, partial [candidate division Zixibacteria bacterium]|nr:(2Fe-2S) ferredoxin domain-containing protein [candidate division Zixibacteria bacterium]NIS47834.1 (2Fe-2S) ferredoxin domain-containing protein [candidate division Zixibacteria bacterium]NIU15934.1 (2Fe-2S) ferredoxin domain-containing protein [candidate division Zixibacteria bacterium]NIV08094.1 NADH-quinone oxidoreductase subunit F [candidate division Zixibacteria bacterium]NIW47336.1 NADH-quinone oxidoreductase subunit F [Gammaproteobacteria bacterium]